MERMRPDDHFMVVMETDATPMHIGALLILKVDPSGAERFSERIKAHFINRLKYTPLLRVLEQSPEGFDADAWFSVPEAAADSQIKIHKMAKAINDEEVFKFISEESMRRIDLSGPPFEIHILENVVGERAAVYLKVHHCVTDGVGFQHLVGVLSDNSPNRLLVQMSGYDEVTPSHEEWRKESEIIFESEKADRERSKLDKATAIEELAAFNETLGQSKTATPDFELTGPTSAARAYRTLSVPLKDIKSHARALGAKVNDVFHWLASTAVRSYLAENSILPAESLSVNSARSYRSPEHGEYGNRIVALRPKLATEIEDPLERLKQIQLSMRVELARSEIELRLLNQPEKPFGAGRRREHFAKQTGEKKVVLTGNVTLSNVPGPAEPRRFAGYYQIANYPVPLLGNGRFLNITSRRNEEHLDWGIMVDPDKVPDIDRFVDLLRDATEQLADLATANTSVL